MKSTYIPQNFREKYTDLLGNEAGEFFSFCMKKTPKSLWANSLKIRPDLLVKSLEQKGWELEELFHENAFEIRNVERPGNIEEFGKGLFNLQEKAAMAPSVVLAPQRGETVLDATAAPGNKTLQLACMMNGTGRVVAVEKNVMRCGILRHNIKKFGMISVIPKRMDILQAKKQNIVDRVLLDAPCSSEGLVRREFDALKNWSEELVREKSELQKRLISKCFEILKPGGTLVYSTCSFAPEENEGVVQHLIDSKGGKIEKISLKNFKLRPGLTQYRDEKYDSSMKLAARIYPQDNDTQQFFLAKVRKL